MRLQGKCKVSAEAACSNGRMAWKTPNNSGISDAEIVTALDGDPPTSVSRDADGYSVFYIFPRELTPEGVKRTEGMIALSNLALCVTALMLAGPIGLIVAIIWCMVSPPFQQSLTDSNATNTELILSVNALKVRQSGGPWRVCDRRLKHRFVPLAHDKTRKEQDEQDLRMRRAQRDGRIIAPQRYYAESFHIALEYEGYRHDLLTVYEAKRASAVIARLNYCDQRLEEEIAKGQGKPPGPGSQWGQSTGNLPE